MGWFGGQKSEPEAALRQDRQKCWEARDAYFACLDKANVVKPGDEGKACDSAKVGYEHNCAKSWVSIKMVFEIFSYDGLTYASRLIISINVGSLLNNSSPCLHR